MMLAAVACGGAIAGEAPLLPPLGGELSGTLKLGGAGPAILWSATTADEGGRQKVGFEGKGEGTTLAGDARIDRTTGDAEWALELAKLDLSSWMPALAERMGTALAGYAATGSVEVRGKGVRSKQGLQGTFEASIADAGVSNAAADIAVEGIAARAALVTLSPLATAPAQKLTVREVRAAGVTFREVHVEWQLEGGAVRVSKAETAAFGGKIAAEPFSVDLAKPAAQVLVRATGLGVEHIIALLPPVLRDVTGRIDGELTVEWSPEGLKYRTGRLRLSSEPVSVRLTPTPGLITGQLNPPAIKQWQVLLSRVIPAYKLPTRESNPAYPPLRRVEMGETPLRVTQLDASFDSAAEKAHLRLVAEPVDPQIKSAPVHLDVNLSGPLEELMRMGLNERVRLGSGD